MTISKNNKITLNYINTEKILTNPLTKDLTGPNISKFSDQIFNKKYSGMRGNVRFYEVY